MWWRLPRQSIGEGLGKDNKALFKARVDAGPPPGLVGYDDEDTPIGWVHLRSWSIIPR